jgi:hypothetical protein
LAGLQHTQTERFLSEAGGPFVVCTRYRAPLWAARDEADRACEAVYGDGDFGQASGERARSLRGVLRRPRAIEGSHWGQTSRPQPCRTCLSEEGWRKPKPLAASQRRFAFEPSCLRMSVMARRRSHRQRGHPDWPAQASGLFVETHLFKRRGPGMWINQHLIGSATFGPTAPCQTSAARSSVRILAFIATA